MSNDGYIRMPFAKVELIHLIHLISGVDEDVPAAGTEEVVLITITGYTEWISEDIPPITLGWDWQMHGHNHHTRLRRVSEPRGNLMLQGIDQLDLGHAKTATLLEAYIDRLNWETETLKYLNERYGVAAAP